MILYNTLMGVAAGAGMLLLVAMGFLVRLTDDPPQLSSWAWAFAPLGLLLTVLGAAMSISWPLPALPAAQSPHCCRADNIIFGEPSLFLGVLLLALTALLLTVERAAEWRAAAGGDVAGPAVSGASGAGRPDMVRVRDVLARRLLPLAAVGAFAGLTLFPIGLAGLNYGMFIAPPSEPLSSAFRQGNLETYYIVAAYWLSGLGALLLPFALRWRGALTWIAGAALTIGALLILWVSLVSFYGHIALS